MQTADLKTGINNNQAEKIGKNVKKPKPEEMVFCFP